ncbi:Flc3/Flc1 [Kluyveromyces lactis]|nr:Flc3/Flc1 [Kluyveromyces lactis]
MNVVLRLWVFLSLLVSNVFARRSLIATSLVSCMDNSELTANSFDVVFNPDDGSLRYTLDITTDINGYVIAHAEVYAYGFNIINRQIDPCDSDWKQFCPLYPGVIEIDSVEYISDEYVDMIPGIAYQVPDIDAYLKLIVVERDTNGIVACIQAFFSNGKTVSQTGVKWATAVIAGIGLLTSALLSAFGNSNAASHVAANTMSLFLYFQSVTVFAMEHVNTVPPIAAAWSENLMWSMGLIRVTFMQKIFRWYVQATGGTPTLYLTSKTISVLVQRSLEYLESTRVYKRAAEVLYGNSNVLIFRGIKRLGYSANIEITSIVATGLTFFILCGYFLFGLIICAKYIVELCIRAGWLKNSRFIDFRKHWKIILKGALLRYIYIGFIQITILCFWEFIQRDSPALIVLSCLFIIMVYGILGYVSLRTISFAKQSIQLHNNPAAILYGDQRVLNKYGFFYTMFSANYYYWSCVIMTQNFVKGAFIAFAQASGKTQALALFIIDLAYFAAIIKFKPYLDRATNILNILISTVTLVNSFLFLFFSDLFGQPRPVASIMAWVFFIMNAAFSLILLILILVYVGFVIFSKNPDVRFKPANDDRTSFQRQSANVGAMDKSVADELMALGTVAKEHDGDWQEMLVTQGQQNTESSTDNLNDEKLEVTEEANVSRKHSFKDKILRKMSLRRNKSTSSRLTAGNRQDTVTASHLSGDSSSGSETPITKTFKGTHTRAVSEAENGLIDNSSDFDFVTDTQLDTPTASPHRKTSISDSINFNSTTDMNATSSTDIFQHNNSSYYKL